MPIYESDVVHVTRETKTLGGDTYWVEHPDWKGEERALCYRKTKHAEGSPTPLPGSRCGSVAGGNTWHKGEGACSGHGGSRGVNGKTITTGKGAKTARRHLKRRIDEYLETGDRDELLDLTYELAALRVLFQEVVEHFPDPEDKKYSIQVNRAVTMIQATGALVEKMSRIDARNNITTAQVIYLRVVVADILAKYITDIPARERAVKELMSRVQGGEDDQETRVVAMI